MAKEKITLSDEQREFVKHAVNKENNIKITFPEIRLCTDNAAMIGVAAYYAYEKGIRADLELNAVAIDSLYEGIEKFKV